MRLFCVLFVFILSCIGVFRYKTFYASSVDEGEQVLKTYDWVLVKIDTLNRGASKVYLFHYKK